MSATLQQIPTGTWTVDPIHSTASFAVKHLGISTFRSSFEEVDARLADGVLTGSVKVESIAIDQPDLKGHLLGEEFFDVARTPTVDFRSTSIEPGDNGSVRVLGEITIKGVTQPVVGEGTLAGPIEGMYGERRVAFEVEAEVDRYAHGLRWNADLPGGGKALAEKVRLIVHLELVEQA
ncbi:MAG TPA: YceI family protein [Baekduia sp.]|nr:YceI family protein [Baekduia sp.]